MRFHSPEVPGRIRAVSIEASFRPHPFDNGCGLSHNSGPMPRAPFITFEGSEGCGKSTQVQRLASRLEAGARRFLLTREPGGTPIGEKIRDLLQFAPESAAMQPETELLLFEASRSQLVREIIEPALQRGLIVIADRFFDSTTVYQGAARKLDAVIVEQLNSFAAGRCRPDLTLFLDVDVDTARTRLLRRVRPVGAPDRMEQEPVEFYERVAAAYRDLAAREPERVRTIDASRSVEEMEAEIWRVLRSRFPEIA
ncbi:MAG: dTMP kinase [Verrucomicrobiota bacterium]|nr:dTMP kinase [Verrucomicrobiota bacterium]